MAKRTQRWIPDTCDQQSPCIVIEEYDDSVPDEPFVCKTVERKCAVHQEVADNELYATILGENQRKNKMHGKLLETDGLFELVTNEAGDVRRKFVNDAEMEWSFTGTGKDRVLHVEVRSRKFENIVTGADRVLQVNPNHQSTRQMKTDAENKIRDIGNAMKGRKPELDSFINTTFGPNKVNLITR